MTFESCWQKSLPRKIYLSAVIEEVSVVSGAFHHFSCCTPKLQMAMVCQCLLSRAFGEVKDGRERQRKGCNWDPPRSCKSLPSAVSRKMFEMEMTSRWYIGVLMCNHEDLLRERLTSVESDGYFQVGCIWTRIPARSLAQGKRQWVWWDWHLKHVGVSENRLNP